MAFVENIDRDDKRFKVRHRTTAPCGYIVGQDCNGRRILQLNTYGSPDREIRGRVSQTLQFDELSAKQLYDVLKAEFGFD